MRVESNQKFAGDSDWFNGLTVTIKNVSDRSIDYVAVLVLALNEKNGVRKKVDGFDNHSNIELAYGVGRLAGTPPGLVEGVPLRPGATVDLQLDERWRDELHRRLKLSDASTDLREVTLRIEKVAFHGTNRCWLNGFSCRRTRNGSWLIVN